MSPELKIQTALVASAFLLLLGAVALQPPMRPVPTLLDQMEFGRGADRPTTLTLEDDGGLEPPALDESRLAPSNPSDPETRI